MERIGKVFFLVSSYRDNARQRQTFDTNLLLKLLHPKKKERNKIRNKKIKNQNIVQIFQK